MSAKHTLGPWHRNIKPVTKYPVIFAGRNVHIAKVLDAGIGLSEAEANADLLAAAPDLLAELELAHQVIRNALAVMTIGQKLELGKRNAAAGCDGEGITRANEREAVIKRARGEA